MTKEDFKSIEKLYHYTKFNTSLCILESNALLFNHLRNMNDINELYRPLFYDRLTPEIEKKAKQIIESYQQISLTRDFCRMGFDIPAMWGHYGDKGTGVCLVFDKTKLLSNLSLDIHDDVVEYVTPNYSFSVSIKNNNDEVEPFNDQELKDFFFKKTCDWSYEQEYRLIIKGDMINRYSLPLKDSLIAVIMHDAYLEDDNHVDNLSTNYNILTKKINESIIILEYGSFIGERHLKYMNHHEFETPYDDTIWCSNDNLHNDLITGKAWIEGTR